ncbi:hypothetical protein EV586_102220 [Tumebacillus sp. BK434]|nr:hypothetical protein EV586_102220 [Tumebacillus sp. BK434]
MKLYGDGDQLHLITSNLMLTYTIRREYSDIERMLAVVEEALADFPEAMGLAYYTRMKVCEDRGEIEEAKKYAYLSLEQFEQTNDEQIGKALINTAHFEFLTKNYKKAAELLLTAIDKLIMHDYFMLIAVKEYVKTLVRLKEYEAASSLIEKHLPPAQDYPELHGKLQLLYSIAKETPEYAIKVCENDQLDKEVRYMASKYLTSYYSVKDDSDSVLKYYKLGRMLSNNRNEFHEGDL